jgi:UDP-N-acetylglucosamine 2-epimerase (non-hydrolysing)
MDGVFLEQLRLPEARYNLEVGSGSHAKQTAKIMVGVEHVLRHEKPSIVLVEGDTNTVLAAALASVKLGVNVGHVEAGLRSYDRQMPEEINRVLTDHCSDLLFAPTEESKRILLKEGIHESGIFVTGNTIVDAVVQNLKIAEKKAAGPKEFGVEKKGYFLATVHRQENVDNMKRFSSILKGLQEVHRKYKLPIIYSVHPRAKKQLGRFKLETEGIMLTDPLDYLTFLQLENNAKLVLTDSGGVQEEACTMKVPCVTLRYNTERPETLEVGANMLAGTEPTSIVKKTGEMLEKAACWKNPFGEGKAGKKIIETITNKEDWANYPRLD